MNSVLLSEINLQLNVFHVLLGMEIIAATCKFAEKRIWLELDYPVPRPISVKLRTRRTIMLQDYVPTYIT